MGLTSCGNCGADILVPFPEEEGAEEPVRECKWCGNSVRGDDDVCPECQRRKTDTSLREDLPRKRGPPSRKLALGAVYLMFTGMAAIGWGALLLIVESAAFELSGYSPGLGTCGVANALLGMVSLAGGALAIGRRSYLIALIGSLCSFLCIALFMGSLLGIFGMIIFGIPLGAIGPWLIYGTDAEFG